MVQINKECKSKEYKMTPLSALCQHNEIYEELIKYFIDHGADINKGVRDGREKETMTPLIPFCQCKEVYVDLIKYFIEHGAVITKEVQDSLFDKEIVFN